MKKSLIALAVLAASGAAMAQSSVTLFGIVDANLGYVNHTASSATSNGGKVYGLGNSGNATSRLGLRGTEDLGGGLKAGFWLEGGLTNDDGNAKGFDFKRESTVRLSGGFGEVRLGRELTPTFRAINKYDVFGAAGVGRYLGFQDWNAPGAGSSQATIDAYAKAVGTDANRVRASNMITYATPNFSGFNASVAYAFDEKTSPSYKAGRYAGGMVGYDNGPLSVTASYAQLLANTESLTASLGASYDFGVVKLTGMGTQTKYKYVGSSSKFNSYLIGLSAPVGGVGEVKAQYAYYDQKGYNAKAQQFSLGYVHNLSKRTALYGTVAFLKNNNNSRMALDAAGVNTGNTAQGQGSNYGQNQTGAQVGIRHAF